MLLAVVTPALRVGGGEDGGACVERCMDASFCDRDCLLFHSLVDRHLEQKQLRMTAPKKAFLSKKTKIRSRPHGQTDLVLGIHLVEFVDATYPVVG